MRKIVVALPKGQRLLRQGYALFAKAGFVSRALEAEIEGNERKHLEFASDNGRVIFLLVRVADIPQYVDKNWADMGISAFDCYREYELSNVTARNSMRGDNFITDLLPDLQLCTKSRFCVAGPADSLSFYNKCKSSDEKILTVATQHPNIASQYFLSRGIVADVVMVSGSTELMPKHGGVDVIFDIVESGRALQENELVIFEEALPIQTRLLVSKAALKYDENMTEIVRVLSDAVE